MSACSYVRLGRGVRGWMAVLALSCGVQAWGTVYVSQTGDNTTGDSWATAYSTVQAGIDDADVLDEEVWVVEGTYAESISLKSGVALYGGFAGTETLLSQRDVGAQPTILDGSTADAGGPVRIGAGGD